MALLDAKKDVSSSTIISSLNSSSDVASGLPHVWFGELDADPGWVNQQASSPGNAKHEEEHASPSLARGYTGWVLRMRPEWRFETQTVLDLTCHGNSFRWTLSRGTGNAVLWHDLSFLEINSGDTKKIQYNRLGDADGWWKDHTKAVATRWSRPWRSAPLKAFLGELG